MPARSPMEVFASRKVEEMIGETVSAMRDALQLTDAGAIHRLRVSLRRLQQALRTFEQFFGKQALRRVRKRLKEAIKAAGDLRNHDVALELAAENGADLPELRQARGNAEQTLRAALQRVMKKDLAAKWRDELRPSS
jgi:CHAD domain-containing protein